MQLLEKKKNQQILDTTENIECLCNLLKTVGKKLDVEKAQVCMYIRMYICTTYKCILQIIYSLISHYLFLELCINYIYQQVHRNILMYVHIYMHTCVHRKSPAVTM